MEFKNMTSEELEMRKAEIATMIDADDADLDALTEEVRGINAELQERKDAESKKAEIRSAVAGGVGEEIESIEMKEEKHTMDIMEYRNSKEYGDLFAEYIKTGDDKQIRAALMTVNAPEDAGTIAVPTYVYDEIKTAWERVDLLPLIDKANFKGNLAINFEVSGTDAAIHPEGGAPVAEEDLVEGIVTIVPQYVKKWKSFSKQVYSLRGEAFVRYIYREISYRIFKKLASILVNLIANLPAVPTSTSPSAAKVDENPGLGVIAKMIAELSDEATDLTLLINKGTWAAFKEEQYAANYPVDVFENVRVIYTSALPSHADASTGDVYAILGDLRNGVIANFPNGDEIEFTFDALSRKKENLIEVLGELYCGAAVVADKAFCLLTKPESIA